MHPGRRRPPRKRSGTPQTFLMNSKLGRAACCSAPGKVLLAGGYLILDRPHAGSVLALDARFFSCVESCALAWSHPSAAPDSTPLLIEVHSPQFGDVRRYAFVASDEPGYEPLAALPLVDGDPAPKPNRPRHSRRRTVRRLRGTQRGAYHCR